jgi:hypothetical protein
MIFADIKYSGRYEDIHDELFSYIKSHFENVEGGLQGDSWICISLDDKKVQIDTFLSMTHQVKSSQPGTHVEKVIEVLMQRYEVSIYQHPELEPHEPQD